MLKAQPGTKVQENQYRKIGNFDLPGPGLKFVGTGFKTRPGLKTNRKKRDMMKMSLTSSLLVFGAVLPSLAVSQTAFSSLQGAWRSGSANAEEILVLQDGYFSFTSYNTQSRRFDYTYGGRASLQDDMLDAAIEFHSSDNQKVGTRMSIPITISGETMTLEIGGKAGHWKRVDDGRDKLAGCWRISERWSGGKMNPIKEGARKTLKLLSETRFQWFAINTDTKEFLGTGGGTYEFRDGKYTEHIEFFSRNNSRVGASLEFDAALKDGEWLHSGLSSKGDPIKETWVRYR